MAKGSCGVLLYTSKKSLYSSVLLCLCVLSQSAFSLFLTASPANNDVDANRHSASGIKKNLPTFSSASKTENGVSYEYTNDNGKIGLPDYFQDCRINLRSLTQELSAYEFWGASPPHSMLMR